jgi:hypothetical protein
MPQSARGIDVTRRSHESGARLGSLAEACAAFDPNMAVTIHGV